MQFPDIGFIVHWLIAIILIMFPFALWKIVELLIYIYSNVSWGA